MQVMTHHVGCATCKLAQKMMAFFTLTSASGQYWDAAHQNALGSETTTINQFTLSRTSRNQKALSFRHPFDFAQGRLREKSCC